MALIAAVVLAPLSLAAPLKVYILAGQSNMEGHAHVRTFPHIAMDPETKPMYEMMTNDIGEAVTAERVWISYSGAKKGERLVQEGKLAAGYGAPVNGPKIGPEYTFGLTLEERIDGPILIIKTAWGGRSLSGNFRPPSCRPINESDLSEKEKEAFTSKGKNIEEKLLEVNQKVGLEYQWMVDHVKDVLANIKRVYPDYDESQGYELAGFVWFQGFNDLVNKFTYPNREEPDGFKEYTRLLTHFIKDVRKDFDAPKMPFVIGVMGLGGPIDMKTANIYQKRQQNLRNAMAAPAIMPEFNGNVHAVLTEKCWDMEIGALDEKWEKLKIIKKGIQRKNGLTAEQIRAECDAATAEMFTKEELELKSMATSNGGYHYMGSAKIIGQIGVAFADALAPAKNN